jgi:hypothetical protein
VYRNAARSILAGFFMKQLGAGRHPKAKAMKPGELLADVHNARLVVGYDVAEAFGTDARLLAADLLREHWQIENEGFNELVNQWHADHYFHHHPVAIVALWLILFAAHALFHCFWRGNLKTAVRKAFTRIHIAATAG